MHPERSDILGIYLDKDEAEDKHEAAIDRAGNSEHPVKLVKAKITLPKDLE